MAWLSRSLRSSPPGQISITAAFSQHTEEPLTAEALAPWFRCFDQRNLPVTWGIVEGNGGWHLGPSLIESRVPHELAFWTDQSSLLPSIPEFERQRDFARKLQVPLRTLVTTHLGLHPTLLSRLGIASLVRLMDDRPSSRTGMFRAMGWNCWETSITERLGVGPSFADAMHLVARLHLLVRESSSMNLLIDLEGLGGPPRSGVLRVVDCLADFANRGLVQVRTVGCVASQTANQLTREAA